MIKLLADVNIEGHVAALLTICEQGPLSEIWRYLGVIAYRFDHFDLDTRSTDARIWRTCQAEGLLLITGNRNEDTADSLQAVIRSEGTADSLPVFTLSNPRRFLSDRQYAERVGIRFIDYLFDLDDLHGIGRIFIP